MMSKPTLELIAGELSDDKIRTKAIDPHKKAHMSYSQKLVKAGNYESFLREVTAYVKHHEKAIHGVDIPDHIAFGRAKEVLDAAYSKNEGYVGAYKESLKDMSAVLNKMGQVLEQQSVVSYQHSVFSKVDPLDWDTHVGLAKEYVGLVKKLAPDVKVKSPEQLASQWQSLVFQYASMADSVKDKVERYDPVKKAA